MSKYFARISDKTGHMVSKLSSFLAKDPIIVWIASDSADTLFLRGGGGGGGENSAVPHVMST